MTLLIKFINSILKNTLKTNISTYMRRIGNNKPWKE